MKQELKPLNEPFPADVAKILEGYPQQDGYILTLFRTFANSMRFLTKGVPNFLDKESPLPRREREITILRVTANRNCEYEWGVHVAVFSEHVKLSPAQVAATRTSDHEAAKWTDRERLLIQVVDELCADATISDETNAQVQETWDLDQQLEILALCGTYHTVSFVANATRQPNEPFGAPFPKR
jgi:alkylhydroperoxidase family enzyme